MKLSTKVLGLSACVMLGSGTVWALLLVHLDRRHQDMNLRTSEFDRRIMLVRTVQVTFKKQVQEWKNILLRGHDAGDLETYRTLFLQRESDVARDTERLLQDTPEVGVRSLLVQFLAQHRTLGGDYRGSLEAFLRTKDAQASDRLVRSIDRSPTDLLDQAVGELERSRETAAAAMTSAWNEGWRTTLALSLSTVLIVLLAVVRMGFSLTGPIGILAGAMRKATESGSLQSAPSSERRDELGHLYRAFGALLQTVRERDESLIQERNTLMERAERLRLLTHSASDGILSTDAAGQILTWNRAASDILGYTPEEMVCKPLLMLIPAEHQILVSKTMRSLAEEGGDGVRRKTLEIQGLRKDSSPVDLALSLFSWRTGGQVYLGVILRDVTEQRKVGRLKDDFISTVSHELRTPLTAIRGSLGLLSGGVIGGIPAQARTMIEIAHKNCERLSRLVNDILDMEKIESGKLEFHLKPQEVRGLVQQAIDTTRAFADTLGIRCVLEEGPAGLGVMADPDRLLQVLTNLISNACKFSPRGESVTIGVAAERGLVKVRVADRGPGIPDEFRKRIFQKFAQAETSDARIRQGQGTGLGLSISKAIVERMNGAIGFESEIGRGTTFFFSLPRLEESSASRTTSLPYAALCGTGEAFAAQAREALGLYDLETVVVPDAARLRDFAVDPACRVVAVTESDSRAAIAVWNEAPASGPLLVVLGHGGPGRAHPRVHRLPDAPVTRDIAAALHARLAPGEERPLRILHVDAQGPVREAVEEALRPIAKIAGASSLEEAWKLLRERPVDLLLLDLYLPDGCGLDLVPILHGFGLDDLPVVVYSDSNAPKRTPASVKAVLRRSHTSPEQLLATVRSLAQGRPADPPVRITEPRIPRRPLAVR
ncbi:MAG TPA: ATP-binding protein [Planctomycetota bacterium]|nr:ATP-binding protein [Planctomycetota bacterium]